MYGNSPARFIDHLGLVVERRPIGSDTVWEVSAKHTDLVSAQTLHGPALKRSRFDVSPAPTPDVPGGMPPKLFDTFDKITQALAENPTLAARLDRIITTLVAVSDHQVPAAIEWGSTVLSRIPLQRADGTTKPTKTFTDPRLCAAIVDRLTFGGNIIETGTHSYRLAHTRGQSSA